MAEEIVEVQTLDRAVSLLDAWIEHAAQLRADLERTRQKLAACRERIAQLQEIVRADLPPKYPDE
jgi:hypothetical protein